MFERSAKCGTPVQEYHLRGNGETVFLCGICGSVVCVLVFQSQILGLMPDGSRFFLSFGLYFMNILLPIPTYPFYLLSTMHRLTTRVLRVLNYNDIGNLESGITAGLSDLLNICMSNEFNMTLYVKCLKRVNDYEASLTM